MKLPGEDDLWPRPQWYSIVCPQCGRPAARLVDKLTREKMLALRGVRDYDAE